LIAHFFDGGYLMQNIISRIFPLVVLVATIGIFLFAVILSMYILYYVALFGLVVFAFTWVKGKLFGSPPPASPKPASTEHTDGRVIDHDNPQL
jgi:hypothetical protein